MQEFLAYLKANPGKVTYASQGNGSTSHLTASMFMQLTGTEMVHVPYKGTAPALVDLVGGAGRRLLRQPQLLGEPASRPASCASSRWPMQHRSQRAAASADLRRELESAGMKAVTFFAVVAPPGTPKATVAATQQAIAEALQAPDVASEVRRSRAPSRAAGRRSRPADFIRRRDRASGARSIKSANVTVG